MLDHTFAFLSGSAVIFIISLGNAAGFVFFIHQFLKPRYHWLISYSIFTLDIFVLAMFRESIPPEIRAGLLSPLFIVLFTTILFYGNFKRKLIIAGACFLSALVIESVTGLILFIMRIDYQQLLGNQFFDIVYSGLIVPVYCILIAIILRPVLKTDTKLIQKEDGWISLMVLVTSVVIALLLCFVTATLPVYNSVILITALLNVCLTTGSLLLFFYLLRQSEKAAFQEKEQALLKQNYEHALERKEQTIAYSKEIDDLQVGMDYLLGDIIQKLNGNSIAEAKAVIEKNLTAVQSIKRMKNYENNIADYFISKAGKQCLELGINFTVDCSLAKDTGIDETDFCVILSNILDNALKACAGHEGERSILLNMHQNDNILFIGCSNTRKEEKRAARTFRRLGSFGLRNIKETAEKYQGDVRINQDDSYFSIEVLLYC